MEKIKKVQYLIADSSAVAGVRHQMPVSRGLKLLEAAAWVSGTEATTATIKIQKYPNFGSSTSAADVAVIVLPASNVQGKGYYKRPLTDALSLFEQGSGLVINQTVASTADKGIVVELTFIESDDLAENISDMVLSS